MSSIDSDNPADAPILAPPKTGKQSKQDRRSNLGAVVSKRQLLRMTGPTAATLAEESRFWVMSDACDIKARCQKITDFVANPSTTYTQVLTLLEELSDPQKAAAAKAAAAAGAGGNSTSAQPEDQDRGKDDVQMSTAGAPAGSGTTAAGTTTTTSDSNNMDKTTARAGAGDVLDDMLDEGEDPNAAQNATLMESLITASLKTDAAAHVVSFLLSPRMLKGPSQRMVATVLQALDSRLNRSQMLALCLCLNICSSALTIWICICQFRSR